MDLTRLSEVLSSSNPFWMILVIIMFVPQTLAIAWRWRTMVKPLSGISFQESVRQILASSCLNLVIPGKAGDLAKGVFLFHQKRCTLEQGLQVVVFEKLLDLASLSFLMLIFGFIFQPTHPILIGILLLGFCVVAMVSIVYFTPFAGKLFSLFLPSFLKKKKIGIKLLTLARNAPDVVRLLGRKRQSVIVSASVGIWILHLTQIVFIFKTVGVPVASLEVLVKMPMAIFSGLLPLTVAGFGIREWAIIALFEAPGISRASLLGVGVLFAFRYIMPAICGSPIAGDYYHLARKYHRNKSTAKENKSA